MPPKRLLRLTNSEDLQDRVPYPQRAERLTEVLLEERLGERFESRSALLWPNQRMSDMVRVHVADAEPDAILLRINGYWVTHESVPLKLKRRLGRAAGPISAAGKATGRVRWLADRRSYQFLRRWLLRTIGGVPLYTLEEVAPRVEAALRVVLESEGPVVAVRGPYLDLMPEGTKAARDRAINRLVALDAAVSAICQRLHIPYLSLAWRVDPADLPEMGPDKLHSTANGQRLLATWDADVLGEAWEQAERPTDRPTGPR